MEVQKPDNSIRASNIILEDREGRDRIRITPDDDGSSSITFLDAQGKTRLKMGLTEGSIPHLSLNYAEGNGGIEIEVNDELNSAGMIITGPQGRLQVLMGLTGDGVPALALFNESGKLLFPMKIERPESPSEFSYDWDKLLHE